jgi:cysteine-rich repeat protein
MSRNTHLTLLVAMATLVGCADYAPVGRPELAVSAEVVAIGAPTGDARHASQTLTVTNVGDAQLDVASIVLSEDEKTPELHLVDAEDMAAGFSLEPGGTAQLRVRWSPEDGVPNSGTLTVKSNGGDLAIPITTVDIDAILQVDTLPAPVSRGVDTLRVELDNQDGSTVSVSVSNGARLVDLTVETVGLASVDTQTRTELGAFSVFTPALPAVVGPAPTTFEFDLVYHPEQGARVSSTARVLIQTNVGDFNIDLVGIPCVRTGPGDVCGTCGDGARQGDEECDSREADDDLCAPDCTWRPVCGNELVESGEGCDDGNNNDDDGCDQDCQVEDGWCGDGTVDAMAGEECDEGEDNGVLGLTCRADCTVKVCGDGIVDADVGEFCEYDEGIPCACARDTCDFPVVHSGRLTINGPDGHSELQAFHVITGDLVVSGVDVTVLSTSRLQCVGGTVQINRTSLETVSLPHLEEIGRDLQVLENRRLADINGLEALNTLGLNLTFNGNLNLRSLEGLSGLSGDLAGNLTVSRNGMRTLTGLGGIETVSGAVLIGANEQLDAISHMASLRSATRIDVSQNGRLCQTLVDEWAEQLDEGSAQVQSSGNAVCE